MHVIVYFFDDVFHSKFSSEEGLSSKPLSKHLKLKCPKCPFFYHYLSLSDQYASLIKLQHLTSSTDQYIASNGDTSPTTSMNSNREWFKESAFLKRHVIRKPGGMKSLHHVWFHLNLGYPLCTQVKRDRLVKC